MKSFLMGGLAFGSLLGASAAFGQGMMPAPVNVVSLSATAAKEVAQDTLSITLATTRDGPDAAAVQLGLKQALDAALAVAKAQAQSGAMDVRTGAFSLYPRYDRQGKITGWNGSTELVLDGKDFARISATAGKVQTLSIQNVGFSLSRQAREAVESEVQADAIARFKVKADGIAKQFGFGSYTLREVNVSSADQQNFGRPRMVALEMKSAASMDSAVPVEAGKSSVTVNVSGAVVLK